MPEKPYVGNQQLRHLSIFLSDGPNLTCRSHTRLPNNNGHGPQFLSYSLALQAVREALMLGLSSVRLCGGDALNFPGLDALLDPCETLELRVTVETGGQEITSQRAQRLARFPQCSVLIDLDGADSATHDMIHGIPGGFDSACETIETLSAAGVPVQIVYTLMRSNAVQVEPAMRLAEQLGARSIRFSIAQPEPVAAGMHGGTGGLMLLVEELIALGRRLEREYNPHSPLAILFDQPPAFRGLQPEVFIDGGGRCDLLHSLTVLPSGEYALCGLGRDMESLRLGKIGEVSLSQIWNGHPMLARLREGLPSQLEGICGRCALRDACLGNCAVENYARTGSFFGPGWFCETADRAGLFPAGRLEENRW